MNILQINSSARIHKAYSTQLADLISTRLLSLHRTCLVRVRDLATQPLPPMDEALLKARETPLAERSPVQRLLLAQHAAVVGDLLECETLVLGVPMYNFGVSVQLKAWMDAVAQAGATFRYTARGPEGLVTGKKVYVALARGSRYPEAGPDNQTPHLRQFLEFLGMTDITFIAAEGLNQGDEAIKAAFESAQRRINEIV